MVGFNCFISNRMEILAEQLAQTLTDPPGNPFAAETVIVQNRSMERWISMQLALRHGLCANIHFPFPRAFLLDLLKRATGSAATDGCEPRILAWRLWKALPDSLGRRTFAGIRHYLDGDATGFKRYQLAVSLSRVLDGYLIFRPAMILAWEQGDDAGAGEEVWQAELWRMIRDGSRCDHVAGIRDKILHLLLEESAVKLDLPKRICIFGISTLPPFYLDLFQCLARRTEVNAFFMNPCREFWGEIRSGKEQSRLVRRVREQTRWKSVREADLYLEEGNGLLAALGRRGRDFFARLEETPMDVRESFVDPGDGSLLAAVQSDILNLRDRGGDGGPGRGFDGRDRSIRIHACHGPMREVEILHDQLLDLFAGNPKLLPKDIVVMAPDIDTYTPLIEAVFGAARGTLAGEAATVRIPYSIADRGAARMSPLQGAFLSILNLAGSRFGVSQVLSLLDAEPLRRRFGLDAAEVEVLRREVSEAGVRWGIDGADRGRAGLPTFEENTWRAGLDRLLMGYALPAPGGRVIQGIVPYAGVEGNDARALGRFMDFVEALFAGVRSFGTARRLGDWAELLSGLCGTFFETDLQEDVDDLRAILHALEELRYVDTEATEGETVDFAVVRHHLEQTLGERGNPYGYLTGGITFCSMVPMRSIPFGVVCLIGLNNADYPRHSRETDFDLLTRHPRPGDPSRRDDDRYLFLEALLSARDTLYISYTGLSSEDNTPVPPSVLVTELIDTLERHLGAAKVREHFPTVHPLQAFHPAYFTPGSPLFSYSRENCAAAAALASPDRSEPRFAEGELAEPTPGWKSVDSADLKAFFANPSRFLLERRVGLFLSEEAESLEESERFGIEGLERHLLGRELLESALDGVDPLERLPVEMAAGALPHGTAGVCHFETLCRDVRGFARQIAPHRKGRRAEPLALTLEVGDFRLTGRIDDLYETGLLHYRFAAARARDHLRFWIDLLLWKLAEAEAAPHPARLMGTDRHFVYTAPEDPRAVLASLLDLYGRGLRSPLVFFPESSFCFAEALTQGGAVDAALRKAEAVWRGNDRQRGEGDDPCFRRCFGKEPPFGAAFQELARAVFGPLLACRGRGEG